MNSREDSMKRLSLIWGKTRTEAGVSQEKMAEEMNVSRKTIQNWEKGITAPDLEQGFRWFKILGANPMSYVMNYVFPDMEGINAGDELERLRAALFAIVATLSEENVRQLLYLLYGYHGSSPRAILHLINAHLQTPMKDRVTQAGVIIKNYEMAYNQGKIIAPDHIQPDLEFLHHALAAGEQAVYRNADGYVIRSDSKDKSSERTGNTIVRHLVPAEIPDATDLMWSVFMQFEGPDYSQEGIETFREFINNPEAVRRLKYYGAFEGSELVGVLSMREPQHISAFFVKEEYHRKGIGRALFNRMREDYEMQEFTVNSSPYAVHVYEKLGFAATDSEQLQDGIRYTPMIFK